MGNTAKIRHRRRYRAEFAKRKRLEIAGAVARFKALCDWGPLHEVPQNAGTDVPRATGG